MNQNNNRESINDLERAIFNLHGCNSKWLESVPIVEKFSDNIVWDGVVQIFKLIGHPQSIKCYAWSHSVEGSTKRKFHAVLHFGPVDSPQKAVQAAIIARHKK